MTEEIIGVIALAAGVAASVAYNKFLKKYGTRKQRFVAKAKENYCSTNGVATKTQYRAGDRSASELSQSQDRITVKYEYVAQGKIYYKKLRFYSRGFVTFPDKVIIYYDKNNPKKCVAENEVTKSLIVQDKGYKTLGLFVAVVAAVVFILKPFLG